MHNSIYVYFFLCFFSVAILFQFIKFLFLLSSLLDGRLVNFYFTFVQLVILWLIFFFIQTPNNHPSSKRIYTTWIANTWNRTKVRIAVALCTNRSCRVHTTTTINEADRRAPQHTNTNRWTDDRIPSRVLVTVWKPMHWAYATYNMKIKNSLSLSHSSHSVHELNQFYKRRSSFE